MRAGAPRAVKVSRYVTRDLDEAVRAIEAHFNDLRIQLAGPKAEFRADLDVVELGGITIGEISFGVELQLQSDELDAYDVAWALCGGYSLRQGCAPPVQATTGQAAVLDPAAPNRLDAWAAQSRAIVAKIDKLAVRRQLEALLGRPVHRPVRFAPVLDVRRGPGRSWAQLAHWSLLEKDVSHGLLQQPIIAGRLEQTLLEGLLLAADHQFRDELAAPPPRMPPAAVKRVMDVVRERPAEPYDAARLAEIAQVSLRTLQEAFRRNVGMSPMSYVQEVRLQRVREQLRVADPAAVTVTDVAYAWGFAHLGRFARRYRARFGELPSQTLRAA